MNGQEHDGTAEEFAAAAHKPLAQEDDQDTAAAWAAVAASAITETDRDRREISAPGIVPPRVPKPRLPGVGPLPGPLTPPSPVTRWPGGLAPISDPRPGTNRTS